MNRRTLLDRILSGRSDTNIPFEATCNLLENLGFKKRVKGSHHIATLNDLNDSSCGSSCFYCSASICVHLRIIS